MSAWRRARDRDIRSPGVFGEKPRPARRARGRVSTLGPWSCRGCRAARPGGRPCAWRRHSRRPRARPRRSPAHFAAGARERSESRRSHCACAGRAARARRRASPKDAGGIRCGGSCALARPRREAPRSRSRSRSPSAPGRRARPPRRRKSACSSIRVLATTSAVVMLWLSAIVVSFRRSARTDRRVWGPRWPELRSGPLRGRRYTTSNDVTPSGDLPKGIGPNRAAYNSDGVGKPLHYSEVRANRVACSFDPYPDRLPQQCGHVELDQLPPLADLAGTRGAIRTQFLALRATRGTFGARFGGPPRSSKRENRFRKRLRSEESNLDLRDQNPAHA